MTPETPDSRPEHDDERRLGHTLQLFATLDKLGFTTKLPDVQRRWREGIRRYGAAFIAYLTFDDLDREDPELLERFAVDYVATYANRTSAIAAFVEEMGWSAKREHFGHLYPEADLYLMWDIKEIETAMRELYTVIELNGQTCLFLK
jgi:hypothetical protein